MDEHDELMKFFEVLTTLRNEYAQSDNPHKVEMISSIAQLAVIVIKEGKIPDSFQLTHAIPYKPEFFIEPVNELFNRLSIEPIIFDMGKTFNKKISSYYVTFTLKHH